MPSIHPHSTSIILSRQVKRVPRVGYWSLAKRPPPGGAWKGKKEKKKTTFCDIILISWVTSARVAFISFHMQILNITLRLVPENMECKNMDRDSVCFLICFFPLRIEEGRRRAHAACVCKRYYSWLNSTHNIRELNIYFLYMAKKIFFFRLPFSSSSPGFWGNYLWPYLAPLLVFFFFLFNLNTHTKDEEPVKLCVCWFTMEASVGYKWVSPLFPHKFFRGKKPTDRMLTRLKAGENGARD